MFMHLTTALGLEFRSRLSTYGDRFSNSFTVSEDLVITVSAIWASQLSNKVTPLAVLTVIST